MENWQRYQPGLDLDGSSSTSDSADGVREKPVASRLERVSTGATEYDLEKQRTGPNVQKTATGQAQIGADDEVPRIELKTFLACLAISFLWTGSQIPLYMLLVCID